MQGSISKVRFAQGPDAEALIAKFYDDEVLDRFNFCETNIVGDGLTVFDALFYSLFENMDNGKTTAILERFPKLKARLAAFTSNANIAAYLAARKVTPF